jgi:hypothetical protein
VFALWVNAISLSRVVYIMIMLLVNCDYYCMFVVVH